MNVKSLLSAGLAALALGLVATTAQAAPAAGLVAAVDRDADRAGPVEKVTWYGDYGYRPRYGYRYYRPYDYGYGYRRFYGHRFYGHRYGWRYGYRHW